MPTYKFTLIEECEYNFYIEAENDEAAQEEWNYRLNEGEIDFSDPDGINSNLHFEKVED